MNERGRNESDISRYTDVEYSPEGYKTVYRWGDFLEIAGGHVYNAMDTIDLVSTGGEYEGFNPRYAYTCEFVGCSTLVDGVYAQRTGDPDGLRAYCDPIGVGWNYGPIYYFPHESVEQIVGQLCEDGDDFPILFDGENVIEAFDGSPVHMSAPVEVDGERVWTCGYDFCWGETVAPDFSRARGHFPDATVAAWAAARSVNESDGYLGIKERM